MKKITQLLTIALALVLSNITAHAEKPTKTQQASSYYQAGVKAQKLGNVAKARRYYKACLKLDPKHGNARHMLHSLKAAAPSINQKLRKKAFSKIIIKKIVIEDATLSESLSILDTYIQEKNPKLNANFAIRDPKKAFHGKSVTMDLKNIPASTVLELILSSCGGKASFGPHVTTISPLATR